MTLLYSTPIFLEHRTVDKPESPFRLQSVVNHLHFVGMDSLCRRPSWEPISLERLAKVHSLEYAAAVEQFCAKGGGMIEVDTEVSRRSYEVALMAAGAVCDAVERVLTGDDPQALCLVRPPGHHALTDAAMGFCLFNNIATGARIAVDEFGLKRVLIVDWDVHHGNGTQATFWNDANVGFYSIHRHPFYPGTGTEDETGTGEGLGMTRNVPIEFGIEREAYLKQFSNTLQDFADFVRPELILISAGFDAHRNDPVGSLGLDSIDFKEMTQTVLDIAKTHCDGKLVSVLEGGYNPQALTESVEIHLERLFQAETA